MGKLVLQVHKFYLIYFIYLFYEIILKLNTEHHKNIIYLYYISESI